MLKVYVIVGIVGLLMCLKVPVQKADAAKAVASNPLQSLAARN